MDYFKAVTKPMFRFKYLKDDKFVISPEDNECNNNKGINIITNESLVLNANNCAVYQQSNNSSEIFSMDHKDADSNKKDLIVKNNYDCKFFEINEVNKANKLYCLKKSSSFDAALSNELEINKIETISIASSSSSSSSSNNTSYSCGSVDGNNYSLAGTNNTKNLCNGSNFLLNNFNNNINDRNKFIHSRCCFPCPSTPISNYNNDNNNNNSSNRYYLNNILLSSLKPTISPISGLNSTYSSTNNKNGDYNNSQFHPSQSSNPSSSMINIYNKDSKINNNNSISNIYKNNNCTWSAIVGGNVLNNSNRSSNIDTSDKNVKNQLTKNCISKVYDKISPNLVSDLSNKEENEENGPCENNNNNISNKSSVNIETKNNNEEINDVRIVFNTQEEDVHEIETKLVLNNSQLCENNSENNNVSNIFNNNDKNIVNNGDYMSKNILDKNFYVNYTGTKNDIINNTFFSINRSDSYLSRVKINTNNYKSKEKNVNNEISEINVISKAQKGEKDDIKVNKSNYKTSNDFLINEKICFNDKDTDVNKNNDYRNNNSNKININSFSIIGTDSYLSRAMVNNYNIVSEGSIGDKNKADYSNSDIDKNNNTDDDNSNKMITPIKIILSKKSPTSIYKDPNNNNVNCKNSAVNGNTKSSNRVRFSDFVSNIDPVNVTNGSHYNIKEHIANENVKFESLIKRGEVFDDYNNDWTRDDDCDLLNDLNNFDEEISKNSADDDFYYHQIKVDKNYKNYQNFKNKNNHVKSSDRSQRSNKRDIKGKNRFDALNNQKHNYYTANYMENNNSYIKDKINSSWGNLSRDIFNTNNNTNVGNSNKNKNGNLNKNARTSSKNINNKQQRKNNFVSDLREK